MVTAVVQGAAGYCATSDLSRAGLQAALDRASEWAEATKGRAIVRFDPTRMPPPRGEYETAFADIHFSPAEIQDLLVSECREAKLDGRIVERTAALSLVDVQRV